ncbi:energy transducer TonB [Crocinitomix algicola]|uniref:energy transducer TonB n=1 Tax=Crocinitomix algicola TaxID=1740263 RepID=UPI0008343888|nr:energy transducer TonB [Crocinitomix algicola]
MIAKKNRKVDLERKRFAFFQIGLIVSGSLCLAAFEYSTITPDQKQVKRLDEPEVLYLDEPLYEPVFHQPKQEKRSSIITPDDELILVDKDPVDGQQITVTNETIVIGDGEGEGEVEEGFTYVVPSNEILPISQDPPEFPGGDAAMAHFIRDNIDIPEYAQYEEGTVYVGFVVNRDGSIEQVVVEGSVNDELDAAATDVVKKMPKWKPGKNAGKPVRVRFTVPIRIRFR